MNNQEYASAKAFKDDVALIFSNVHEYFGGINTPIGRNCVELRKSYDEIIARFKLWAFFNQQIIIHSL